MAATLEETLLAPDTQPQVIADCFALIEQEVAELSGISGAAVKLAYKTINTFKPGHIRFMIQSLLPDLVSKLEPYWADFRTSGSGEFGDYLAKRGDDVSQALLSVTDARAAASGLSSSRHTDRCAVAPPGTSRRHSPGSATWC